MLQTLEREPGGSLVSVQHHHHQDLIGGPGYDQGSPAGTRALPGSNSMSYGPKGNQDLRLPKQQYNYLCLFPGYAENGHHYSSRSRRHHHSGGPPSYRSTSLIGENPHKYLLYAPTLAQLLLFLAAGSRELPQGGALLLYLSADACFGASSGANGRKVQSNTDESKYK